MEKIFQPDQIEQHWYTYWESHGFFSPKIDSEGKAYSIMIPPPNVTGSLHMGHAFQHTIMDILIRYRRMMGDNTLWQVGTDHAGIATQMVVERKLDIESKQTRHDLGREAFIDKIWDWKTSSGGAITHQMRRLGNSVDWPTERFTMDEGFSKAVQTAFIQLFEEGLIYRGKRLVNWDPKLHTAISDLEVENIEEQGHLWHFRYPLCDGACTNEELHYLVVATTRPETMLGDTAVAVHPSDERYSNLIGKFVELPLVKRRIPIIADEYVDKTFGTGCVKITPAHDFNDYQVGQRHQLPMINIMTVNAALREIPEVFDYQGKANNDISATLPAAYSGLDRFEARKKIISDFDSLGLLDKIDEHTLKVPRGDRSGLIVEPMLTDQWFVDAKKLAKPAIEAVENGDITFVPKQYENMYFAWMRDIQDWCISRQLWWGHRIPAWYDNKGNIYVGESESAIRTAHNIDASETLTQDDDVLDTWFSSALWTFGTLGWPEKTQRLERFHPSDVLVTGFDIIFFWVARMIMMTMHLIKDKQGNSQVPFKTVYVTGLIRDEQGQKMSKSKGNVLDPLDMIDGISIDALLNKRTSNMMQPQLREKIAKRTRKEFPEGISAHGTDALRFTLAALASTGRDINWDMNRLEGYRNFCNKLWNAARYVLMQTEKQDCGNPQIPVTSIVNTMSVADRWILSSLQQLIENIHKHFENYRFDLASQCLYEFIWNEYCDWYLELSKPILSGKFSEKAQSATATRRTLLYVLDQILRLCHPIMPYITEEIWHSLKPVSKQAGETLMLTSYPSSDAQLVDKHSETTVSWIKTFIIAIRNIRGELNVAPGKQFKVILREGNKTDRNNTESQFSLLCALARLEDIHFIDNEEPLPATATQIMGQLEIHVPLAGIVDKDAEIERLKKAIDKLEKEKQRLDSKLSNAKFVEKAPKHLVEAEREKLKGAYHKKQQLQEQQKRLEALP